MTAEEIDEGAANASPAVKPVCPHKPGTTDWRNWYLNKRPYHPTPFRTEEAAEQCMLNAGYGLDDDDLWRNRFGKVEAKIIVSKCGRAFGL
jgi:hypothetical protein